MIHFFLVFRITATSDAQPKYQLKLSYQLKFIGYIYEIENSRESRRQSDPSLFGNQYFIDGRERESRLIQSRD